MKKKNHVIGMLSAMTLGVVGLVTSAHGQTVTMISNPYAEFGLGELQNAKFTGVNVPADGVNQNTFTLDLFLGGIEAFSVERRPGAPTIGQAGYTGALTGTTTVNTTEILFWDGFMTFNNGSVEGTNVILMQSSAASGDVFDMALVFDLVDRPTWPISGELTNVYFVCDPVSGSFTMDSAIAAAAGGPTNPHIPEPVSTSLLALGAVAFLFQRRK